MPLAATCDLLHDAIVSQSQDLIYRGEPLPNVLRLLCLYGVVHGGIPKRHFDGLRRDLLNTYGPQHLLTLSALGKAGLFQRREGRRSSFPAAKAAFRLLLQEGEAFDGAAPTDIHFAYAGYAPLSVRLVQQAVGPGWAAGEAVMFALPGAQFEVLQTLDEAGLPVERRDVNRVASKRECDDVHLRLDTLEEWMSSVDTCTT